MVRRDDTLLPLAAGKGVSENQRNLGAVSRCVLYWFFAVCSTKYTFADTLVSFQVWIGSSRSQILCKRSCGNVCATLANVALLRRTSAGQRPDREKTYLLTHHVPLGFQCTRSRYTRALLARGSHGTIGLDYQSPLLKLVAGMTNASWTSKQLNSLLVGCSCTARKPGLSCARAERSHRACRATHP